MTMAQLVQTLLWEGHNHEDRTQEINTMLTNQLADKQGTDYLVFLEEKYDEWNVCGTEKETAYSSTRRKQATEDCVTLSSYYISPLSCHYTYSICMKR
jgi:hypothetical protein